MPPSKRRRKNVLPLIPAIIEIRNILPHNIDHLCTAHLTKHPPEMANSDFYANFILHKYCPDSSNQTALSVSANGNCLFNAASVLLCGDEHMAMELRLRTLIELACNKQYYLSKELASAFNSFANYDESVIDCAKESGYSSIWTMWALSFVLERDIISLYPAANGSGDLAYQNLNVTLTPRLKDVENEAMYIMWSRVKPPARQEQWTPSYSITCVMHFPG